MSQSSAGEPAANNNEETPAASNRLWWILGGAAGGVGLLLVSCCCAGAFMFWAGGSQHPARLVGTWEGGGKLMFLEATGTIDFRSNGRVDWTRNYGSIGGNSGSGTWKVEQVDGEKYVLKIIADTDPANPVGWSVTFEGNDTMTIVGFDDMAYAMTRK